MQQTNFRMFKETNFQKQTLKCATTQLVPLEDGDAVANGHRRLASERRAATAASSALRPWATIASRAPCGHHRLASAVGPPRRLASAVRPPRPPPPRERRAATAATTASRALSGCGCAAIAACARFFGFLVFCMSLFVCLFV